MNKLTITLIFLTMLSCGMPVVSVTIDTEYHARRRPYVALVVHKAAEAEGDKWRMP